MRIFAKNITIAAVLIAGTAYAQKGDRHPGDPCKDLGQIAWGIMNMRQTGKPLHELMEQASSTNNPLLKEIIIKAYERPAYPDGPGKTRAETDFRNDIEVVCYKAKPS